MLECGNKFEKAILTEDRICGTIKSKLRDLFSGIIKKKGLTVKELLKKE